MKLKEKKFLNKFNIPAECYAAIATNHYVADKFGRKTDYSVSTIISPIQQTILNKKYSGTSLIPKRDILDNYWSWIGSVLHGALEVAWRKEMGSIVEERLYMEYRGKTISGMMDCYHKGQIRDYKTMRLFKWQKKDFYDYECQQNMYAYLCKQNNMEVKSLRIISLMLDWKRNEAKYKKDYPESPINEISLPLWSEQKQKAYLESRVDMLIEAEKLADKELSIKYPCSREEQWSHYKDTAVQKVNGAKAVKVFKTFTQAENNKLAKQYMKEKGFNEKIYYIEDRYTEKTRCNEYCDCAGICHQKKAEEVGSGSANLAVKLF